MTTVSAPVAAPVSRAINVSLTEAQVVAACAKHGAAISAIESLMSGGTRVVLQNIDDADRVRSVFAKKVISGNVVRARWVRSH